MQRLLCVHILSEQSGKLSAGHLSGVVVSRTRMFTTCPFRHKFGSKGMIQLSASHALLVLRDTHLDEYALFENCVTNSTWRAHEAAGSLARQSSFGLG
jgi:acyl-CoA thioesterase